MTAIALTAAQIAPAIEPSDAEIFDYIAAATITAGQAVYITSAGKVNLASANTGGAEQFRGIALNGGGAGQAISVLKRGHCYGFTISSLAYDAIVYLADTAGGLDTAASGTKTVRVGRVVPLTDSSLTKVLYVQADYLNNW